MPAAFESGDAMRIRLLMEKLRASLWLVPMTLVAVMVVLGTAMPLVDRRLALDIPLMAGAGIAGARGMLQAMAASMITLAGLVFSMTLVVLSQASAQYSSRVMRGFLGDRVNQVVLGTFLGIYAYCLMALRGLGDDGAPVPVLTVLVGIGCALAGMIFLTYFIHHVAKSLQVENIVAAIQDDTLPVIDRLYPEQDDAEEAGASAPPAERAQPLRTIAATASGYVQDVDVAALQDLACRSDTLVEVPHAPGDFVVAGQPLLHLHPTGERQEAADMPADARWRRHVALGRSRTIQQDPGFGIRQLVDVALRALSPGINDTTAAILVLDRLAVLMNRLCQRAVPSRFRRVDGRVRLILARPDFEHHLGQGFDQIRQWGSGNPAVLARLLEILRDLRAVTTRPDRLVLLRAHADRVLAAAEHGIQADCDRCFVRGRYRDCVGEDA